MPNVLHRALRWGVRVALARAPFLRKPVDWCYLALTRWCGRSWNPARTPYAAWLEVNAWNARREGVLREALAKVAAPPAFSLVMPVYNPPLPYLELAFRSVQRQTYPNWELCVADDASTAPGVRAFLEDWARKEPRIRLTFRPENGNISRATNSAAELARHEFLVFLDQDDELEPNALGELALYLARQPETDVLYSDDDKCDAEGRRYDPQFKPDWSPELLLSCMYLGHILCVRRSLFQESGGLRPGFEGSQDYDLVLRVTERARHVGHVPKVLYHWRALKGSTAVSGEAKPQSSEAGRRALQEALDRRGVRGTAGQPEWAAREGCGVFVPAFPDDGPRVAILIPVRNGLALLRNCLASLARTRYHNYSVYILDNESDDPEFLAYLKSVPHPVVRLACPGGRFNFAWLCNRGAEHVQADYVLFLNNDTEVRTPKWLSQMAGHLGVPGVGAVGARLLYPDGRVQHAGIVHGLYDGLAGPAFKLTEGHASGYMKLARVARNCSAVTAACLLTKRDLFLKLGGFDEQNFGVAYNDVDFGYRLCAAGHRVVYCPGAELLHREGATRGCGDHPAEEAAFTRKYRSKRDPYYNPNLSLDDERFAVAARTLAPEDLPPVRALLCGHGLSHEGAPHTQFEITRGLKRHGILDPLVHSPSDGPLRAAYEKEGIAVWVTPHPLANVTTRDEYERAIERFAEELRARRIEVVYGNTILTFYAMDAAARAGLPCVFNPRESEPVPTHLAAYGPAIFRRALRCFEYPYQVVFAAEATRAVYADLNRHANFTVVHNGLDRERLAAALAVHPRPEARKQLGVRDEELMVLLLGTVCERKGQLELIHALGLLDDGTAAKLRVFIVGDRPSPYSAQVHRANAALPAGKARATIVPETGDAAAFYAAADIFVCTSRIESYPRVILEALACGLPIVTTPAFGIAEQVRDGVNGLCYTAGRPAELAAALRCLALEPELRLRLAENGRHVLDRIIDYEGMVAAYGRIMREAWLSGGPRPCAASSD